MKGNFLVQGETIRKQRNSLTNFKNLLLKNHRANFYQTWHKASLGDGDSSFFFFQMKGLALFQRDILEKLRKYVDQFLLKNHRANFNQTWLKTFMGDGDSTFLSEGSRPFPRGGNSKNTLTNFKNLFVKNHRAIFNQNLAQRANNVC